ncbi:unnamed protein product [Hapterophycus canaliculatus]
MGKRALPVGVLSHPARVCIKRMYRVVAAYSMNLGRGRDGSSCRVRRRRDSRRTRGWCIFVRILLPGDACLAMLILTQYEHYSVSLSPHRQVPTAAAVIGGNLVRLIPRCLRCSRGY